MIDRTRPTVLVVQDENDSRQMIVDSLEEAGFAAAQSANAVDALARLSEQRFDLVVADVEMPRLDGFLLTERLRATSLLADLPVIIVSARSSDEDRRRGLEAGAQAYIVKSAFDQTNLLDTVERLLR